MSERKISNPKIFSCYLGNSKSRTNEQAETTRKELNEFMNGVPMNSYLAFTDGSVVGEECFGRMWHSYVQKRM